MEILNKSETAELLRVSQGWIDRAMKRGDLPFVKMGGKVFFRRETLEAFVKNCERTPIQQIRNQNIRREQARRASRR